MTPRYQFEFQYPNGREMPTVINTLAETIEARPDMRLGWASPGAGTGSNPHCRLEASLPVNYTRERATYRSP